MKNCPNCNAVLEDTANFCPNCGMGFSAPSAAPVYDPYDHTKEFEAKDISDNKVIAMLVYLLGIIGIFLALIAAKESPYTAFHVRQALKIKVTEILTAIVALLLCWTLIVPIAAAIFALVLLVIKIICFVQICTGKAVEAPIVRSIGFLK